MAGDQLVREVPTADGVAMFGVWVETQTPAAVVVAVVGSEVCASGPEPANADEAARDPAPKLVTASNKGVE